MAYNEGRLSDNTAHGGSRAPRRPGPAPPPSGSPSGRRGALRRAAPKPEIHRVDPEFGSTLKALIEISSQTAGSTCEFWVNPVNFTSKRGRLRRARRRARRQHPGGCLSLAGTQAAGATRRCNGCAGPLGEATARLGRSLNSSSANLARQQAPPMDRGEVGVRCSGRLSTLHLLGRLLACCCRGQSLLLPRPKRRGA
jgi:hypothetical protein